MSQQGRKQTKPGSLTPAFMQAAARDPEGGLSYMLLAAFGVSLDSLMSMALKVLQEQDTKIGLLALTAGVQIRNHVVFVTSDYGNIRSRYPSLIIEGQRETRDIFNFGALHALGHVLAHVASHDLATKILSKAGSCVTGAGLTDNEAGGINREIFTSWAAEDKAKWPAWQMGTAAAHRTYLDAMMTTIAQKASAFSAVLNPGIVQPAIPVAIPAAVQGGDQPAGRQPPPPPEGGRR